MSHDKLRDEDTGWPHNRDNDFPSEVEAFNPDVGPGGRSKKNWKDVPKVSAMPTIDTDVYATKKSVAQGFMDVALLSANADQLRTLLKTGESSSAFFVVCIVCISFSMALQLTIATLLLYKSRYNINRPEQFRLAERLNNVVMICSVFLTAFNIIASSFMPEVPAMATTPSFNPFDAETVPGLFPRGGPDTPEVDVEPVVGGGS